MADAIREYPLKKPGPMPKWPQSGVHITSVQDFGSGIAAEDHESVSRVFIMRENMNGKNYPGFGIDL
jgi:5,10-methenyltetrahydromethanopterin hydrogenase